MVNPQVLSSKNVTFLSQIGLIATDMDGTLTDERQFKAELLVALAKLQAVNLPVLIVTGRSAGWVSGLTHYLPVFGAIAENGGIYFSKTHPEPVFLQPIDDLKYHRQKLSQQFEALQQRYPTLVEAPDNRFRLTDWTFDITGLSPTDLDWMADSCKASGWGFTYSTVQCHIKCLSQEKACGLGQVLSREFPALKRDQVLTVGDSPNDESLFDRSQFPHSVGVANIRHYLERLAHKPTYLTRSDAGEGFSELVHALLGQL
ncbi:MAG: HAD hydrolase family protein [Cyanobacteria bacterium P01_A01_bin.114]